MQRPIYKEFKELLLDLGKPIWRDQDARYEEQNLWFGEAGNATPLHHDMAHNFLVQIYGKKRIRLFSPEDTKYLYRQTSQAKYHLSQIHDIDTLNKKKYPLFKNAVAYEGILHPGETLFIPCGWWHDVRSIDHAISVNFWWKAKPLECFLPQILPASAYEFYEDGKFHDIYDYFLDLSDFKNDLEISKFFIQIENYWLAVLFMANFFVTYLKSIATLLSIPTTQKNHARDIKYINNLLQTRNKNLGVNKNDLSYWLKLIAKAKKENNNLFRKDDILEMLEKINIFSNKAKNKLYK